MDSCKEITQTFDVSDAILDVGCVNTLIHIPHTSLLVGSLGIALKSEIFLSFQISFLVIGYNSWQMTEWYTPFLHLFAGSYLMTPLNNPYCVKVLLYKIRVMKGWALPLWSYLLCEPLKIKGIEIKI